MTQAVAIPPKRAVRKAKVKTLVVNFVLDETGSMLGCADATISGFNEYIGELAKRPEPICFTLTKFNSSRIDIVHAGVPIGEVVRLSHGNYQPDNLTPLYDAVARTIKATEAALVSIPNHAVLCAIMTDGEENASHEYTRNDIFALIKSKQDEGWTFAFLGADQDAWDAGAKMGIPGGNTMSYAGTPTGTKSAMGNLAASTVCYAASGGVQTDSFFDKTPVMASVTVPPIKRTVHKAKRKPKLRNW